MKVFNADAETTADTIALSVTNDCPGASTVSEPDFDPKMEGSQSSVQLVGGAAKTATVLLTISRDDFTTFNRKAPNRCTLTFTATTVAPVSSDRTPDNNVMQLEVNVVDRSDPEQATPHESLIKSINPVVVRIPKGTTTVTKMVHPILGNADFLPVSESPGHTITAVVSDGTCPPGTMGMADYDSSTPGQQNSVTIRGGTTRRGVVSVTIDATTFHNTPNAKAAARCVAALTATGPDSDASNNTTHLVIDVIDNNDL